VTARLGDFAAAERYAATVARETGPPAAAGLPRDLELEIRAEAAIVLFGTFEGFAGWSLIYAGPSHMRRAALHERLGDRSTAATHYERFLTLWKDADPEFRSLLDSARAGLARVGEGNTR